MQFYFKTTFQPNSELLHRGLSSSWMNPIFQSKACKPGGHQQEAGTCLRCEAILALPAGVPNKVGSPCVGCGLGLSRCSSPAMSTAKDTRMEHRGTLPITPLTAHLAC